MQWSTDRPSARLAILFFLAVLGVVVPLQAQEEPVEESADTFTYEESRPPIEAQQAYDMARSLLEEGRLDDAVGEFHRALRLAEDVNFGEAHLGLAQAYFKLEDFQQARSAFTEALSSGNRDNLTEQQLGEAYNGLGETYLEFGSQQYSTALQNFQEAARIDYKNKDYLVNLGTTLVKVGQPDPAIKVLNRAIAIDPQLAKAYDARAQAHGLVSRQRAGEFELALADFDKAIQLDPIDRTFYFNLGTTLLQNQRPLEAIAAYSKAIDVDRQLAQTAAAKAAEDAKAAASQPAEASQPPAADQPPTPQAEKPYEPYIEPILGRALSFLEVGMAIQDQAQRNEAFQRAVADSDLAIALNPYIPTVYLSRGMAMRLLEQYDDAIRAFTRAAELSTDSTQATSEALYRRGIVWYYKNEPGLAMIDFIRSSQNNPEDARAYMWQGFLHCTEGNYYDAIAAYSRAAEQNERFIPAFKNRALAYMNLSQFDKAIDDFNQVIRIDPTSAAAYYQRGVAQELMGEPAMATKSFQMAASLDPAHHAARRKLGLPPAESPPAAEEPARPAPTPPPAAAAPDHMDAEPPEAAPPLAEPPPPSTTAPLPDLPPPPDVTVPPSLDELFPDT